MDEKPEILVELEYRFGKETFQLETTRDGVLTLWVSRSMVGEVLRYLKYEADQPYRMLYDLSAIDERLRTRHWGQNRPDFTVVYYLISFDRNQDIRFKVALSQESTSVGSIVNLWPSASWYEREAWDMFGIRFDGHPNLRRILLPPTWTGHPLRKEHPARATEMGPFQLPEEKAVHAEAALEFKPEEWGISNAYQDTDLMFLNMGPQHPSTHGVFRLVLALRGEQIQDCFLDIGYHHRGAEKMGERQSWHTFIPYTDRIDYLGGVLNNFPYLMTVEKLAGIEVPDRAKVIRIMMAEFFRIASHLVFYGTMAQDVGQLSPVFYMFTDRERVFSIVEAVCGGRMHPEWFRIGGVAQDLPQGWENLVRDFVKYLPPRLAEYDDLVMRNRIFKARTRGVAAYTKEDAIEWGVTGPNLRACGLAWDLRKKRPYSAYDQFDFDIPTANYGDCYDRCALRVEEMRQSLRIIEQCLNNMPEGPYKSDHPLTTPPLKERTMLDIETLINHFLSVSWGPVIPAGEAMCSAEAAKGMNGYYLISDGGTSAYRVRIRTPSFPHLQMISMVSKGMTISDLVAYLGSIDFVMADVDR